MRFQSTQPKRAATDYGILTAAAYTISIHAAQEGCDFGQYVDENGKIISIHAAQEGCD